MDGWVGGWMYGWTHSDGSVVWIGKSGACKHGSSRELRLGHWQAGSTGGLDGRSEVKERGREALPGTACQRLPLEQQQQH